MAARSLALVTNGVLLESVHVALLFIIYVGAIEYSLWSRSSLVKLNFFEFEAQIYKDNMMIFVGRVIGAINSECDLMSLNVVMHSTFFKVMMISNAQLSKRTLKSLSLWVFEVTYRGWKQCAEVPRIRTMAV